MDVPARVSGAEYRRLAARWRRLAEDATTQKARNHLLGLARQCEFLGCGGIDRRPMADDRREGVAPPAAF